MDRFADSVIGLLDRLDLERVIIGGMSMGGYVLLNLLLRYPPRITAALLIATRAGGDDPAGQERRTRLAEAALRGDVAAVTDPFADILFAPDTWRKSPELVETVRGWMAQISPAGLAAGLLAMRDRADFTNRLHTIQVPALVVGGAEDRAVPQDHFQVLAENLPGARSCLIPGGGHLVNLEQPARFNACLLDYLEGLKVT
jgi:pimeloyl-ACP methyl ester carboxylesterase